MNIPSDRSHPGAVGTDDGSMGLYLHIPFCVKRCHFCAFYLVMQEERRIERFLCALETELSLSAVQLDRAGQRVSTVYIGGGTPTALSAAQLVQILMKVAALYSLTDNCEVTVEATPESLSSEYLDALLEAGVTRLSMGIQTFDQEERACLGLSSTIEQAVAGIRLVKQAGLLNVNFDLIYGIPGQTLTSWDRTLHQACEWEPAHLSCYALSIEGGTLFDSACRRGELDVIETDVERQFQVYATELLDVAGYHQYEISNWSKPGGQCRHNRRYWQGQEYLGLGPSAQSYVTGCRFGNVASLEQYCQRLEIGELSVAEQESLSLLQQDKERVVFGLRLLDGVPISWVEANKYDPVWAASFDSFIAEAYIVQTSERVALTPKGRQFADEVGYQLL
jgi:oxygen-independent coproporphyrinogen-3 oxidase